LGTTGSLTTVVVAWGFGLAFVFGIIASRSNFCTMGALSDIVNMQHWGRMRMWLLAIAVAIIGATALQFAGLVDLNKSIYLRPTLGILSPIVGGLAFGVGMTLASGCANKNLLRIGAGSIRSLVVIVFIALSAYATMKGLPAIWRVTWLDPVAIDLAAWGMKTQSLAEVVARGTGMEARTAIVSTAGVLAAALLIFVFKEARFRRNLAQVASATVLGLIIVAGWYITGHLGFGENPDTLEVVYAGTNSRTIETFSFVAPAAYTLELLLLWTDKSLALTFGIASALGIVLGSLAWALATRSFQLEGFVSTADTRNHVIGGLLMGFGGVTALGCTIGQGVSGVSTLAMGSILAALSIMAGGAGMLKYIYWRETRE
jgi:uncharacterized membrane protein YedE/YeeE